MEETIVDLTQNILSVVVGGAIAISGNYFIEKYKSQKKILENKMLKLEELFKLTDVMQREILSYSVLVNDEIIKQGLMINQDGFNPAKMSMVVRFYFPNLLEQYQVLSALYIKIHLQFNNVKSVDKDVELFHKEIGNFYNALEKESKKLMDQK